jgi:hypothetical protein
MWSISGTRSLGSVLGVRYPAFGPRVFNIIVCTASPTLT